MLKEVKQIIRKAICALMSPLQYQKYLRKTGVTIGKGCIVDKSAIFGSEPWLIRIGDNVRITKNVQFITHDGGGVDPETHVLGRERGRFIWKYCNW